MEDIQLHKKLQQLAEEDLEENEDYNKDCNIEDIENEQIWYDKIINIEESPEKLGGSGSIIVFLKKL